MPIHHSYTAMTGAEAVALAEKAFAAGDTAEATYFITRAYRLFDLQLGVGTRDAANRKDFEQPE